MRETDVRNSGRSRVAQSTAIRFPAAKREMPADMLPPAVPPAMSQECLASIRLAAHTPLVPPRSPAGTRGLTCPAA
jgi:hypothetical protein